MEIEFIAKLFDLPVCLASLRRIAAPEFSRGLMVFEN